MAHERTSYPAAVEIAVRMGMSVRHGEVLADLLLRTPADVTERVMDQLWLRTVLIAQRRHVRSAEREEYDARADRLLAALDPNERSRAA